MRAEEGNGKRDYSYFVVYLGKQTNPLNQKIKSGNNQYTEMIFWNVRNGTQDDKQKDML